MLGALHITLGILLIMLWEIVGMIRMVIMLIALLMVVGIFLRHTIQDMVTRQF